MFSIKIPNLRWDARRQEHCVLSDGAQECGCYPILASNQTDYPWGAYTDPKGNPNATCKVGIPDGVLYIVNRSYVVDEEMGVVNIFCRFGTSTGMPDSHTFRLVNGRYRWIHTLSVSEGPMPTMPKVKAKSAPEE